MCYRPLKIFNPSHHLTTRDKIWLEVPCGKCEECRKRNRNDWFVRAFFEYLHTTDVKNGVVFYVTLTYDNHYLPTFFDRDTDTVIPCFSKNNVQLFIKRLREALVRVFGVTKDERTNCLKYFVTSEYGGQSSRPHHHALIYVNHPLSYYECIAFKQVLTKKWKYGFVHFGKKVTPTMPAGVVTSAHALFYCCKYISKDLYFPYEQTVKGAQPFHLQSQGFGAYMIDYFGINYSSQQIMQYLIDGTFIIPTDGRISSSGYRYAIPQYITRKWLYDYESKYKGTERVDLDTGEVRTRSIYSVKYTLNKLGVEVQKARSIHSIEFMQSEFDRIFKSFKSIINDEDSLAYIHDKCPVYSPPFSFTSVDEYSDFISENYLSRSSLFRQRFVLYTTLFKDRIVVPYTRYFKLGKDLSDDDPLKDSEQYDYSYNSAMLYLDDIYKLDSHSNPVTTPIENAGVTFDSLNSVDFIKSTIASHTYASDLNPKLYNIYETLLSIFNCCLYVIGKREDDKQQEMNFLYENAKLSQPLAI